MLTRIIHKIQVAGCNWWRSLLGDNEHWAVRVRTEVMNRQMIIGWTVLIPRKKPIDGWHEIEGNEGRDNVKWKQICVLWVKLICNIDGWLAFQGRISTPSLQIITTRGCRGELIIYSIVFNFFSIYNTKYTLINYKVWLKLI